MRNFIFICIIFLKFKIKFYKIAVKMVKKKNKSNLIDQIIFIFIHINYYTY